MVTIIRRSTPKTVIRRSKPVEPPSSVGKNWPLRPGYPYFAHECGHHVIDIHGQYHVLCWSPNREMWTCGLASFSPSVIGVHEYRGSATIVYRQPPTDVPKFFRRKLMK